MKIKVNRNKRVQKLKKAATASKKSTRELGRTSGETIHRTWFAGLKKTNDPEKLSKFMRAEFPNSATNFEKWAGTMIGHYKAHRYPDWGTYTKTAYNANVESKHMIPAHLTQAYARKAA